MDMGVVNLTAGARGTQPLVRDDADRYELIERVSDALGALVLAYCVMDTHLHVVAEGPLDHVLRWLGGGLAGYLRAFNRRHGEGGVLRGPIDGRRVPSEAELGRAIHYVHENPVRTKRPLAGSAIEFPWSSARAFAGLSMARVANVDRALALLGAEVWRVAPPEARGPRAVGHSRREPRHAPLRRGRHLRGAAVGAPLAEARPGARRGARSLPPARAARRY